MTVRYSIAGYPGLYDTEHECDKARIRLMMAELERQTAVIAALQERLEQSGEIRTGIGMTDRTKVEPYDKAMMLGREYAKRNRDALAALAALSSVPLPERTGTTPYRAMTLQEMAKSAQSDFGRNPRS